MSLMICSEGVFAVPDFCLIFAPRLATMSQKSSFPHPTDSVQYVLTSNTIRKLCQSQRAGAVTIGWDARASQRLIVARSILRHIAIGTPVSRCHQRFQIENRGQSLPMLQHLGLQFLQ